MLQSQYITIIIMSSRWLNGKERNNITEPVYT